MRGSIEYPERCQVNKPEAQKKSIRRRIVIKRQDITRHAKPVQQQMVIHIEHKKLCDD